jgi:hypothetical protein
MLLFYVSLLILFALVQVVLRWRVARLERRYIAVTAQADDLLKTSAVRGGNNRSDPFVAVRQQYELAQLAMKRERVESRYASWQLLSDRFAKFRAALSGYKGKLVPYLVGVLDIVAILVLLDQLGIGVEQVKALLGLVTNTS